jgi:RepB DNA-primase from phage plasmid
VVTKQIHAMGCEVFEVGLFNPTANGNEPVMIPRTWDAEALLRSVSWLKQQNRNGRNIYVRPQGEHRMSLIDDLRAADVENMRASGFTPAVVVQTSPNNFQAWVKHPEVLDKETSTAAARALAQRFGGDPGAADWRHFGRLSGYTNRKDKYKGSDGLYPFVRLVESSGGEYEKGIDFLTAVRTQLEKNRAERARISEAARSPRALSTGPLKRIDEFRADARYGGDGTRVDLAYAVYALSHGAAETEIIAALHSRDLSHKGSQKRQDDYVRRTIQKAATVVRGDSLCR